MTSQMCLRPEIQELLRLTNIDGWSDQIKQIATGISKNQRGAFVNLVELDRLIPGLGQHNINEQTPDGHWVGIYHIEDRPIFRGIQYVGAHIGLNNLDWLTRAIVTESCYHVESSLKRKTGTAGPLSVGMLLHHASQKISLNKDLVDALWLLNRAVYNNAKHTIEDISMDGHMFSVADAIAVYFACRILGARLLTSLGITTKYGQPVFPLSGL